MPLKTLLFRLTESEHRRLRRAAAERGASMQQVLSEALDLWHKTCSGGRGRALEELLALQGCLAGTNSIEELEREHREEIRRDEKGA